MVVELKSEPLYWRTPVRKYAIYRTRCVARLGSRLTSLYWYSRQLYAKATDLFCSRLAEDLLNHVAGYGLKRHRIRFVATSQDQELNFPWIVLTIDLVEQ